MELWQIPERRAPRGHSSAETGVLSLPLRDAAELSALPLDSPIGFYRYHHTDITSKPTVRLQLLHSLNLSSFFSSKVIMVLKRWQICRLLGFNSWTAIQVWLDDVVRPAFQELNRDYLAPLEARGERNPPGDRHIKEFFVRFAEDFDRVVERRVMELEQGVQSHPRKNNCKPIPSASTIAK